MKVYKQRSRLHVRKSFFSNRVVNNWNSLQQQVVDSTSINGFKNALDNHWKEIDVKKTVHNHTSTSTSKSSG